MLAITLITIIIIIILEMGSEVMQTKSVFPKHM